jgi:hypothetical protein
LIRRLNSSCGQCLGPGPAMVDIHHVDEAGATQDEIDGYTRSCSTARGRCHRALCHRRDLCHGQQLSVGPTRGRDGPPRGGPVRLSRGVGGKFPRALLAWAMTQMSLGDTLLTLGGRESGTARRRLSRSLAGKYPRARTARLGRNPVNLANALRSLCERESGTARLERTRARTRAA